MKFPKIGRGGGQRLFRLFPKKTSKFGDTVTPKWPGHKATYFKFTDTLLRMVEKYPEAFHVDGVIQHGQDSHNNTLLEEKEDDPEQPEQNKVPSIESEKAPNQLHIVAPGEGKTPKSLVYVEDWDAKAFWALHPDGKNNLTDKRRQKKLSDLEYFKQRLNNVDPRWRRNTHWVFSAAVFRENIDFQRNIDLG